MARASTRDAVADVTAAHVAEVRAAQQVQNAAAAYRVADNLDLKAQAAAAGMDVDLYQRLSPAQRVAVLTTTAPTLGQFEAGGVDAKRHHASLSTQNGLPALDSLTRQFVDDDDPAFVWVWDKPVNGYHRSRSRVHQTQLQVVLNKGMTLDPIAPVLPDPTVPCPMRGIGGTPCTFKGYTEVELIDHQQVKHPREYQAGKEAREVEQRRLEQEERRLQLQLMQRMIDGQAKPDGGP